MNAKKAASKQTGHENEIVALHAIGTVGWLSKKQVGGWLYPESTEHNATNKAARVLGRLLTRGEVKRRDEDSENRRGGISFGTGFYVLTLTGAARANDGMTTKYFRAGWNLSQLDIGRQSTAVGYLIKMRRQGCEVVGAAGVRRGLELDAMGGRDLKGADGLVGAAEGLTVVLVVRNLHDELVKKAKRLEKEAEKLELLGNSWILKEFRKKMRKEQ